MRAVLRVTAFCLGLFCLLSLGIRPSAADRVPSAELRFVLDFAADSVTVGDPILFRASGAGPLTGTLVLPEFVDSIGPFSILDTTPAVWTEETDRREFVQEGRLVLFETGLHESPRVPLLWAREDADTAVAYASTQSVFVRSLLPETLDLSEPQAALAELREVKSVVALERDWTWAWIAAGALLALALMLWIWRRRRRIDEPLSLEERTKPLLAPDAAFLQGLRQLEEREFLANGELKNYYAGLSLLLRGYLEGRFSLFAVEATRAEILPQLGEAPRLSDEDREQLAGWLLESDLVKFAKMNRGLADAKAQTDSMRDWVEKTTTSARKWAAEEAARALQIASETPPREGGATEGTGYRQARPIGEGDDSQVSTAERIADVPEGGRS